MARMIKLSSRSLMHAGFALVALTAAPAAWGQSTRYSAIVIDTETKEVLHAEAADELRYPASLTKMMTLYLLFEAIDRGEIGLEDRMVVSRFAAAQAPSKLGLKPGATISVENAIRALVTKSANDVAVVIAEKLGGTESRFAAKMTARARQLGMTNTHFANASGLPNPLQRTTARDMATLSEHLLADYPKYYSYFQTPGMSWGKRYAANHNRLLGKVEGVDGIKTGFTNASGYNLASSVVRDGKRLVAVVMGGETAASRDAQVAYLIENAYQLIHVRAGEPTGPAPTVTFTSLPVNRATVNIEEGDVDIEEGSADQMSYSVPLPTTGGVKVIGVDKPAVGQPLKQGAPLGSATGTQSATLQGLF